VTKRRTVEDRLREEYFALQPEMVRVAEQFEVEVRHCLLRYSLRLDQYEQIVVRSRVKECESAINSLRRRQEEKAFRQSRPNLYTLTHLKDLVGIRILVFPRTRIRKIDLALRNHFSSWKADPVPGITEGDEPLAFKYSGYCKGTNKIAAEYQVVSMLIGLFWEVEHSAIYKPTPQLKGLASNLDIRERKQAIYSAFLAFEQEFEEKIRKQQSALRRKK
jgi:hypothetical protein